MLSFSLPLLLRPFVTTDNAGKSTREALTNQRPCKGSGKIYDLTICLWPLNLVSPPRLNPNPTTTSRASRKPIDALRRIFSAASFDQHVGSKFSQVRSRSPMVAEGHHSIRQLVLSSCWLPTDGIEVCSPNLEITNERSFWWIAC